MAFPAVEVLTKLRELLAVLMIVGMLLIPPQIHAMVQDIATVGVEQAAEAVNLEFQQLMEEDLAIRGAIAISMAIKEGGMRWDLEDIIGHLGLTVLLLHAAK